MFTLIEGYFKGESEADAHYPLARARTSRWIGRRQFLEDLALVEGSKKVKLVAYKGKESKCRICGEANGKDEYEYNIGGKAKWVWPAGFAHYVEEHNVRPSLAFQMFITQAAEALK